MNQVVEAHLELLERQVEELEALAVAAASGDDPELGAAVSARSKAAELSKRVAQLRAWQARQQPELAPPTAPKGRSSKWGVALVLVAAGRSTTEIARELGVARSTVNRWRAEPEFAEEIAELQQAQTEAVHALLMARQLDVARCLADVATAPDTTDAARVQAARVFFELLGRHKLSPVQAPTSEVGLETEEEVVAVLGQYPPELLEAALAKQRKERDL